MTTLRCEGMPPHGGPYRGPTGTWQPGEVREVSDEDAARLLERFPAQFTRVQGGHDRMVRGGHAKDYSGRRASDLASEVRAGQHDDALSALAQDDRVTVTRAVEARRRALAEGG